MSKREDIEKRTEELLLPILDKYGCELWDISYVRERDEYFLRIYIDKEGGIMIDDCADVSRALSDALDAEDIIDDAYTLEVSSPGLGRKLVKDREFDRSIGRDVDIKFYKNTGGAKEITGKLVSYDAGSITIETGPEGGPPETVTFERDEIATVRLSVDL